MKREDCNTFSIPIPSLESSAQGRKLSGESLEIIPSYSAPLRPNIYPSICQVRCVKQLERRWHCPEVGGGRRREAAALFSHYKSDLPTLRRCCCHLINLNHLNYSPIILSLKRCRTRKYYVAINVLCKYSESRKDLLESISLIPSWTFPLWGAAPIKVLQLSPPLYILKGSTDCMSLSGI